MEIQRAFSKNAIAYDRVNTIQKKVVNKMCKKINYHTPQHILDIGCGSGSFYRAVTWPLMHFVGIDFAEGMLNAHPKAPEVTLLLADFNKAETFERLKSYNYDRIVSASALQWAEDLDATLGYIAQLHTPVTLAIFTSNTFKTLYRVANLPPLLRSDTEVKRLLHKHFPKGEVETLHYERHFTSTREMFRYMKKSGVGASRNILGYKEMRALMEVYPLEYLEYEIILLHEKG